MQPLEGLSDSGRGRNCSEQGDVDAGSSPSTGRARTRRRTNARRSGWQGGATIAPCAAGKRSCAPRGNRLECRRIEEARREPHFVVAFRLRLLAPGTGSSPRRAFADAPALWADVAAREAEQWLVAATLPLMPPFWGRPGKGKPPGQEQFATDRAVPATAGDNAEVPVFQIGGAGAVWHRLAARVCRSSTGSGGGVRDLAIRSARLAARGRDLSAPIDRGGDQNRPRHARLAYLAARPWAIPPTLSATRRPGARTPRRRRSRRC